MKRSSFLLAGVALLALTAGPLSARQNVPEISYTAVGDFLKLPDGMHLGEAAGVASNSKGDIYVYTRTGNPTMTMGTSRAVSHGGSRLFQFDKTGKFVREIGQGSYGMLQAQQVRIDPQDNVWLVDQASTLVMKFDTNGRVQMLLSRKPEALRVPSLPLTPRPVGVPVDQTPPPRPEGAPAPAGGAPGGGGFGGGLPGAGIAGESFVRPTDVAWDKAGNIYVADGYGNARVAKYEPNGKYIKSWGSRGSATGQFNIVHGIAIDGQGNVYVADEGNKRIQVFDTEGTFKKAFDNVGSPTAICLTTGAKPVLYVAHTGDPDGMEDAAVYKLDLDGKVLGKFGRAGKELKQFGLVNAIDCRNENELLIGELSNWRVQKVSLGK